jgi:putative sterol carrier protein
MPSSIKSTMQHMPEAFIPEKAQGVDAVVQFQFSGAEAGDWVVHIHGGRCEVSPGRAEHAALTFAADSADFLAVLNGEMDGMRAFMQGKLQLAGDLGLAMRLLGFFELD